MWDTQTNSRPRLKNDNLGDDALQELWSAYRTAPDTVFEQKCINMVQAGGGGQKKKDEIIAAIKVAKLKDAKMQKVTNFIMAGMGLGV
jgi:hypothetical protein